MDVCLCCTDRDENNNDVCVKCTDAKMFNPCIDDDDLVDTKTITTMNITNSDSKATIRELLQDEIDRCRQMIEEVGATTKTWNRTVGSLMTMDIMTAVKALKEKNDDAIFRSYRSLRGYN